MLYMGRKVCQPCTLVQCEVRGQGMYARCSSILYEREVDRTARWCGGSDNVPCPMNTLTAGTMLTVAVTCAGMYTVYLNKSMLVLKISVEARFSARTDRPWDPPSLL